MIKNPVLGAIIGDIVGSTYERFPGEINPNFPLFDKSKCISDDSIMTLAIANWLINEEKDLIGELQRFGRKYPNAGYGGTFSEWIRSDNPLPYNSWGNGSAMRVSPVGCVSNDFNDCLSLAKKSAEVTHNHPEGIKGAQATASAIYMALIGHSKDQIKETIETHFGYNLNRSLQEISNNGFHVSCQKSVPEAIICFLKSTDFESTVRNAVLVHGDTDTQAAIAGSIAAAYYGIPEDIAEQGLKYLDEYLLEVFNTFSEKFKL